MRKIRAILILALIAGANIVLAQQRGALMTFSTQRNPNAYQKISVPTNTLQTSFILPMNNGGNYTPVAPPPDFIITISIKPQPGVQFQAPRLTWICSSVLAGKPHYYEFKDSNGNVIGSTSHNGQPPINSSTTSGGAIVQQGDYTVSFWSGINGNQRLIQDPRGGSLPQGGIGYNHRLTVMLENVSGSGGSWNPQCLEFTVYRVPPIGSRTRISGRPSFIRRKTIHLSSGRAAKRINLNLPTHAQRRNYMNYANGNSMNRRQTLRNYRSR